MVMTKGERPGPSAYAVGSRALVVQVRDNPSTDQFVQPALAAMGCRTCSFGFEEVPAAEDADGAWVVFVRYVPPRWREFVARHRSRVRGVILFIDDDVLDWRASAGLPWAYRARLWRLAGRHQRWLKAQRCALWVSCPYLYQKYRAWTPTLVRPTSPDRDANQPVRVFYHGTLSHRAEIRWLEQVMPQVLESDPAITFELVGDARIHKAWRRHPGVTVVHPMQWRAYRAFAGLAGRQIGLVPLVPSGFNDARSYTKFFDITRSGAVGIYADHPAMRDAVRDGEDGLLLPLDPERWSGAILDLARNPERSAALLACARARVSELNDLAHEGYRDLARAMGLADAASGYDIPTGRTDRRPVRPE